MNFEEKLQQLYDYFLQSYVGDYNLIHGDYFPGNVLMDESRRVSALFDFGLMTMVGDPLFDIATG